MDPVVIVPVALVALLLLIWFAGFVSIGENQVGVVVKKFSFSDLAPGKIIAMDGEAGYQAETLAPGWHFFYFPWQYKIEKVPQIVISQGEIGLVVAADGRSIPSERMLGRVVECDDYQDAKKFLSQGGEQGR